MTAFKETYIVEDFPFEVLEQFPNLPAALAAGHKRENLWSIVDGDDPDLWLYGPPHHHVNLLSIALTAEAHDGRTYYEEHLDPVEGDEVIPCGTP